MKEKKKLTYKQQQQREKAKNIIKWVFCCVGWSLLATAFVSLVVVGIRGCNNKKQPAQALTGQVTTPVKPVQPNNVVTYIDEDNDVGTTYNGHAPEVISLIGANESGTTYARYTWTRGMDADPYDLSAYGRMYVLSDSLLGVADFRETGGNTHHFNFDSIRHDDDSNTIDFYDDGVQVYALDERDWSQATKWAYLQIDMTMRSIPFVEGNDVSYVYSDSHLGTQIVGIEYLFTEFFVKDIITAGGSGGADSNGLYGVFSLISQAFESMSSFFGIVVIPGVNIGTLLVLPLIAIIILFIVKLFKR